MAAGLVMGRAGSRGEMRITRWDSLGVKHKWKIQENHRGYRGRRTEMETGSEKHGNEGAAEEYLLKLKHQERGLGV